MAVMPSDGPSPHSPSLRLGLPAPKPLRHHHAQSLLGPSFHDPRTHHVLKCHPSKPSLSPAATMSDDTLLALTLPLHCAFSFRFLVNSEHASCLLAVCKQCRKACRSGSTSTAPSPTPRFMAALSSTPRRFHTQYY